MKLRNINKSPSAYKRTKLKVFLGRLKSRIFNLFAPMSDNEDPDLSGMDSDEDSFIFSDSEDFEADD